MTETYSNYVGQPCSNPPVSTTMAQLKLGKQGHTQELAISHALSILLVNDCESSLNTVRKWCIRL